MVRCVLLLLTLGLAGLVVLGGCGDECKIDERRCIGDVLEACVYENESQQGTKTQEVNCPALDQVCFHPSGAANAECVSSRTPCDPATFQSVCTGTRLRIVCDQYFPDVAMSYQHPIDDSSCP